MFFLKQLGSLLNAVKEIDPDANPSVMIKFKLPNGAEAKAVYVHNSFDGEGDSQGSIVLYNGDDKTEFDSLQYTVDGIQGLCNAQGAQPAITEAVNSNKEKTSITAVGKLELYAGDFSTQFFAEVYSKDGWTEELAIDLAAEIEKQFKPGEIETEYLSPMDNMNDNRGGCTYQIVMNMNISISLSALDSRVQGAMYKFQSVPTIKYNDEGESDANVQTNNDIERQVADNIDTAMMDHYDMMNGDIGDIFESSVKTLCGKAGKPALAEAVIKLFNVYKPVMESIATDKFELVENFPIWAIEPLVNDSWGDYLQYNGEELAREDFSDIDNFMTTHGYCGIHAPSDELYDQTHSGFTAHPAFGKSTDTCSVYAVKGPWKSLMKEYGLETAAPVTESVDSSDSAMYTIEPADDEDGPNDLYIELPASKGWTNDDAEAFAEILKDSAPNSADVFYMGSYAENGTFFQVYIDQKEVRPMTIEEWATPIKETINEIYGDNSESGDIERSVGDSIDTAMMDHYDMMNGDIGDIFESSVQTLCDKAGKPALAEAVIKLFNVYKPVMEAGEAKRHRIPRFVADEANNIIAKNFGWSDELKAKEFEETWDWMERYADAFIPAWNKTDSVEAGIEAIYDAEEHQQCMFDGI